MNHPGLMTDSSLSSKKRNRLWSFRPVLITRKLLPKTVLKNSTKSFSEKNNATLVKQHQLDHFLLILQKLDDSASYVKSESLEKAFVGRRF